MHINPSKPNIHNDMIMAARGANLRDRDRDGPKPPHVAKRYPYSSTRQNTRLARKLRRKG